MKDNKKTAIKLINKYADSYQRKEEEVKSLKVELNDLKTTLSLNKEIIRGLMTSNNSSEPNNLVLTKLKEENESLNLNIERLYKENNGYREKLVYIEQIQQDSFNKLKDENERIKNKIFYLENIIIKKDNLFHTIKKKYERLYSSTVENASVNIVEKEYYIVDPSSSVNVIYNELSLYKKMYENMTHFIKECSHKLEHYEKVIKDQQEEILKLKGISNPINIHQINIKHLLQRKDDEKVVICSTKNIDVDGPLTDDDNCGLYSPIAEHFPEKVHMNNSHVDYKEFLPTLDLKVKKNANNLSSLSINLEEKRSLPIYFETREWEEVLRIVNLTQDEVNRLVKNKVVSKLMNAFEILSKLLNEKDIQIKNLLKDIEESKKQRNDLTNDNLKLVKSLNQLMQESTNLKSNYEKYISSKENGIANNASQNLDESLIGNSSKLTIQYMNTTLNQEDFKSGLNHTNLEINIKKEIEEDESKLKDIKMYQSENLEMHDLMELKINDDVFQDLKDYKEPEKIIKSNIKGRLTPTGSNKLNNFIKEINQSQSMTLNDSLGYELKNLGKNKQKKLMNGNLH